MKYAAFALASVMCFVSSSHTACASGEPLLFRLNGDFGDRNVNLDIIESVETQPLQHVETSSEANGQELLVRTLKVRCIRNCKNFTPFEKSFQEHPLGVVRFKDDSPDIITTWIGDTSYLIVVFRVNDTGMKVVLEKGALAPPVISLNSTGNIEIELSEDGSPMGKKNLKCNWSASSAGYRLKVRNSLC